MSWVRWDFELKICKSANEQCFEKLVATYCHLIANSRSTAVLYGRCLQSASRSRASRKNYSILTSELFRLRFYPLKVRQPITIHLFIASFTLSYEAFSDR